MNDGVNPLERILDQFDIDSDAANPSMHRDRPYSGQPWTDLGERGKQLVLGLTMRDLRDCYVRAWCLAMGGADDRNMPYYNEAMKGEGAALCESDIYILHGDADPMAVFQNMACEIEKIMGIFPNLPGNGE